jgi:hypothetical protein
MFLCLFALFHFRNDAANINTHYDTPPSTSA